MGKLKKRDEKGSLSNQNVRFERVEISYNLQFLKFKKNVVCILENVENICLREGVTDMSFADYLRYWLDDLVKQRVKTSTYTRYHERIHGHILHKLGEIPIGLLTKDILQSFIVNLNASGLSSSTAASIARTLRSSVNEGTELGFIQDDIFRGISI